MNIALKSSGPTSWLKGHSFFYSLFSLAVCLLPAVTGFSQTTVYQPFPEDDAVWLIESGGCCYSNCPGPPFPNPVLIDFRYSYYIDGDTLINGVSYNKFYKSGSVHEYCAMSTSLNNWSFTNAEYVGAFRQEVVQKKVYFIYDQSVTECLWFDFNISVGDTVSAECSQWPDSCATVASIDSVLVGGSYRTRYNLNTAPPYSFIEGIGSTAGLFEPLCPFEYYGSLTCFSLNGQTVYPDTLSSCNNLTGVTEPDDLLSIRVYPNPFSSELNIESSSGLNQGRCLLTDAWGRKVYESDFKGLFTVIKRGSLPAGVYSLQIFSSSRSIYSQRVIIN